MVQIKIKRLYFRVIRKVNKNVAQCSGVQRIACGMECAELCGGTMRQTRAKEAAARYRKGSQEVHTS